MFKLPKVILSPLIIVFFAFLINSIPAHAHPIASEPWLLVNDSTLTIQDNISPQPSKLEWASHIIDKEFVVNEQIKFKVNEKAIQEAFLLDQDKIEIEWGFKEEDFIPSFNGLEAVITPKTTGNFFFDVKVLNANTKKELVGEKVMFWVGTLPAIPSLKVMDKIILPDADDRVIFVERKKDTTFSVVNPDEERYEYTWDMAELDIFNQTEVVKKFPSLKLPDYMVLRIRDKITNTFNEAYVRVDSNETPEFEIVTPAIARDTSTVEEDENNSENSLGIIMIISLIAIVASAVPIILIIKKRK